MDYPGEVIKQGSSQASHIKLIKAQLNALGYGPLDTNNPNFGDTTEQVIKKFQEDNQLNDDGIVGRLTWDRLFKPRTKEPVTSTILQVRALQTMKTQLFVREKTGHNDGAEVKSYLASVGLPEGYAWCQSLVYWCFDKAAKDLSVKNPVPKTAGVLECLRIAKEKGHMIIYDPMLVQEGDQFIMDFGGGHGHTGLAEQRMLDNMYTCEGNTNGEGSREGDGVYERSRISRLIKCYIRYV